jgi:hypothetical protein
VPDSDGPLLPGVGGTDSDDEVNVLGGVGGQFVAPALDDVGYGLVDGEQGAEGLQDLSRVDGSFELQCASEIPGAAIGLGSSWSRCRS